MQTGLQNDLATLSEYSALERGVYAAVSRVLEESNKLLNTSSLGQAIITFPLEERINIWKQLFVAGK